MRNFIATLAAAALTITPTIAAAQTSEAATYSYEAAKECLTASGVFYIFSDDNAEQSDDYARQYDFWLGEFLAADGNHEADLEAMVNANYARLQDVEAGKPATEILAQFADTFNACTDKWGGQIARKIESPAPSLNFTLEESQTCLFSTIAILLVTARDSEADLAALEQSGQFWATEADKHGPLSQEDDALLNTRADHMFEGATAAQTPEQTAAFLAPYEADFVACEAKIKTVTGV